MPAEGSAERLAVMAGVVEPRWKVLIVEDQKGASLALASILFDMRFVVAEARSGAEALNVAAGFRPHIVFIDLVLPDMEGVELLKKLQGEIDLPGARFFSVSGYGNTEAMRARAAGFEAHFGKPVRYEDLEPVLRGEGLQPNTQP